MNSQVFSKKALNTRLLKFLKPGSFLTVNSWLKKERNAAFGVFLQKLNILGILIVIAVTSCDDKWDDHYSEKDISLKSDMVEVVNATSEQYIKSNSDLSSISNLFEEQGIYTQLSKKDQSFTILVYGNEAMEKASVDDPGFFANTCVCDLALMPTKLTEKLSVQMWNGKFLEVGVDEATGNITIAESQVLKIVSVENGFVYVMQTPIMAPKSLYTVLKNLGEDYSRFKNLVFSFEESVFDRENSIPVGVDATGNTVYDTVYVTQNSLMDRYTSGGSLTWSMRSEFYSSTMLVPSNSLVDNALKSAYDYVRSALNREPTAADSSKFEEWIVKAAFYDRILTPEQLEGDGDLYSVSGHQLGASLSTDGAQWRPSIQKVNTANPIELSNGVAYYVTNLKIPNNVVIFRIKNRFYRWENCTAEEKEEYFKWTNLENPDIYDNGSFGPIGPWPEIYYKLLRAYPTAEAEEKQLPVSVECTGISLNEDGTVSVALVPLGEYYFRMGFQSNKYPWRMDIYFNGELVATGANPNGSHYDRTGIGNPEGYIWRDWYAATNGKAKYYDCDGMDVATVTITGNELQPIKIKVVSYDLTLNSGSRNRMILYNWCLRPTSDNY